MPATIRTKLLVALGVVVVLLVVLGAMTASALNAATDRAEQVYALERKTTALRDLRQATTDQLRAVAVAIATGDARETETAVRQLGLGVSDVDRVAFVVSDEADLVRDVRDAHAELRAAMTSVLDLVRKGAAPEARELYATRAGPLADRLDRRTDQLVHKAELEILDAIAATQASSETSLRLVTAIALGSVLFALVAGLALSLSIIRPVRQMRDELARTAAGEFSHHVSVDNRDELGTLARSINAMNDELGQLYAHVHDASRRKSEFLANMSHELRTPLNAVIGFAEVLQQKLFGELNEKQEEYVGDIATSGKHLLSLVNDILDLSKVEAGKMDLQLSLVSLADVVEHGATMIRDRAARRGIALSVEVDPALAPIEADERKLKEVISNLLTNAVKFTPGGGSIAVTAGQVDDEVRVAVRDTGPGIAPADQERIFEEFLQTAIGTHTEESTGLGLTLAKRFIELHGGRIWLESEVGKGTTFTFALPAVPPAPVPMAP